MPTPDCAASAWRMRGVPSDIKLRDVSSDIGLQATRLHELLAPSLLESLETRLADWALRQEELLTAALTEVTIASKQLTRPIECSEPEREQSELKSCDVQPSEMKSRDMKKSDMKPSDIETMTSDNQDFQRSSSLISSADPFGFVTTDESPEDCVNHVKMDDDDIEDAFSPRASQGLGSVGHSLHESMTSNMLEVKEVWQKKRSAQQFCRSIVRARPFEILSAMIMSGHGVIMGHSANVAMECALLGKVDSSRDLMNWVDLAFGCFYCIELVLRLVAEQRRFFTASDWKWNCFDIFMVAVALQEMVTTVFDIDIRQNNVTFLRLFRLIKLLKALRFVRVLRAFRELRLMIASIFGCVKSMLWAMLLLMLITFLFGLFFVQACVDDVRRGNLDHDSMARLSEYWASVQLAMNSLFLASTGGDSWRFMAEPLRNVSSLAYAVFLVYIIFFLFVVTNTLTSLFIDSFMDTATKDESMMIQAQKATRRGVIEKAVKISKEMDADRSGIIDQKEVEAVFKNRDLIAFLQNLEVDPTDIEEFFELLSHDGTRPVTVEQFVRGCMKIRGPARGVDLIVVMEQLRTMDAHQHKFIENCTQQLKDLRSQLQNRQACSPKAD